MRIYCAINFEHRFSSMLHPFISVVKLDTSLRSHCWREARAKKLFLFSSQHFVAVMESDEQLRLALEESLRTARAEEERRASETIVPTAPALPASAPESSQIVSEFERQRQEAIERQKARWHQQHGQQAFDYSTPQGQQPTSNNQPDAGSFYSPVPGPFTPQPAYEATTGPRDAGSLYPSIPGHSSNGVQAVSQDSVLYPSLQEQQTQPAADPYLDELRRRQQQEEEDHRLAMQLAEQYSSEDFEDEQVHSEDPAAAAAAGSAAPAFGSRPYPSSGEDNDWQQVNRTPSMQHAGATAGAGAASNTPLGGVDVGGSYSSRPSSDVAAAAGSTAGSLLGAGLSALLAMAANAAARSAQHQQQDGASAHASTTGGQQHHASSSSGGDSDSRMQHSGAEGAGGAAATAATGNRNGNSSGVQGLLGVAASALWNYMRGRNSSSSSSTATASSSSSSAMHQQQQQQHGRDDQEVVMLQQLMRHLMMGDPPNYQQAASGGNSRGPAQGMGGFRVVNLPGGGLAASYSSGGNRHQQSGTATHDPFGPYMDPAEDLITQLLLAGARSARSNRSQGVDGHETGFTHYDPATGSSRFEFSDQVFGPGFMGPGFRQVPDQGLEALLGALFGGQGLGREGIGNMRYEDLANLDNVNVSTPDDVLGRLPRSKYVEGRKPGDSDTCVICQTQYSPGDNLMHLPCLHAFHEDCITPWLQGHSKKCPVCKTDVC